MQFWFWTDYKTFFPNKKKTNEKPSSLNIAPFSAGINLHNNQQRHDAFGAIFSHDDNADDEDDFQCRHGSSGLGENSLPFLSPPPNFSVNHIIENWGGEENMNKIMNIRSRSICSIVSLNFAVAFQLVCGVMMRKRRGWLDFSMWKKFKPVLIAGSILLYGPSRPSSRWLVLCE